MAWALYGRSNRAAIIDDWSVQRLAQDCRRPKGERGVRSALNVINRIGLAVKDRPSRRLAWVWKLNVGGLDWPMVYNRAAGSEPEIQTTLQNRSESPVRHFRAGGGKRPRSIAFIRHGRGRCTIRQHLPILLCMTHYHAWLRSGRSFLMQPRRFEARSTAQWWAAKARPLTGDRLVLACTGCPRPSRSTAPSTRSVARAVADELGLEPDQVGRVLAAAKAHRGRLKAERALQPNGGDDPPEALAVELAAERG